jgi:hypothetical protein
VRDPREIILALAAADEAADEPQEFVLYYSAKGRQIIGHPGWPDGALPPATVEVDDLDERNWVRVSDATGKGRHFALTGAGREAAKAYERQRDAAAVSAVSLDWSAVNPVLEALFEAYTQAGAPEYGIASEPVLRGLEDPAAGRPAVRELVRGGYLETVNEQDQSDIPSEVRPTPLTLQLIARWPGSGAEAALGELVAAIDEEITSTDDSDKRRKLTAVRDGLLGAARDVAIHYLERKTGL